MALIKCLGCGQLISDKALNCPKCGRANNLDESVGKNSENEVKDFEQIENDEGNRLQTKENNNEQDKLPVAISEKSNEINKNEESANQKSRLPKILFGLIMFGSSVLAFNFISNEIKFANSPCNRECSWDCMMHVREMMGGRVQEIRSQRWAFANDSKDYDRAWDACRNENGRVYQIYLLKNHRKYRNSL